MTSKITLTGEVFPIDGIREQVIAAKRAGIRERILPADNHGDFAKIPDPIREGLRVHFARTFDDVAPLPFQGR